MERQSVQSSNLAEVGYNPNTMTLEVLFLKGNLYQYFDVPEGIYIELMNSSSLGQFFNINVKNSYRCSKL